MASLIIKEGQVFNQLTVITELPRLRLPCGQVNRVFECRCSCGKNTAVRLVHLSRGRIKSCGCLQGEYHDPKYHGLYTTWRGMKGRCTQDTTNNYQHYKGKGITYCDEWEKFSVFLEFGLSNGWAHGLEIDRIDSDKGYYPDNCRFVTQLEQANNINTNIMIEYNGKIQPFGLVIHATDLNEHRVAIRKRIKRGWSAQEAFDTPIRKGNYSKSSQKHK